MQLHCTPDRVTVARATADLDRTTGIVPPSEVIALLEEYFPEAMQNKTLHSSCSSVCSALSNTEMSKLTEGFKTLFEHRWLSNRDISHLEATDLWWLKYIEGKGMFCLLCRIHNSSNKFNKQETLNLSASINFKQSAIKDHAISKAHKET